METRRWTVKVERQVGKLVRVGRLEGRRLNEGGTNMKTGGLERGRPSRALVRIRESPEDKRDLKR